MGSNAIKVNEEVKIPVKQKKEITMKDWIARALPEISKALPNTITPERFARMATTAVTLNPKLSECTPASFIGSMLTAAQLGLEPNTPLGQAYLVPYYNGKTKNIEAQFQLGYRGMIELAHRSGEFKSIEAHCVYENDDFEYELGLEPKLKHRPAMSNRGELTWVYAVYKLKSDGYGFEVMSKADIEEYRTKFSKAPNSPAWTNSWEGMAKKCVIKQALKYAPLKSEFVAAMNSEEVTLNFSDKTGEIVSDETTRYPDAVEVEGEIIEE